MALPSMRSSLKERFRTRTGPIGLRQLRLTTGLILFAYVGSHLLNHALGNISVEAMETGLLVQKWIWQGILGSIALYAALVTHLLLGLWALYERRHFGWTRAEVMQLVLGLAIPLLLANHLLATRISLWLYGTQKGYAQELYSFWVGAPAFGVVQVVLLIVAWTHGCLGVYFWLRLKRFFAPKAPVLLCAATVLPLLALLGFFQGGRHVAAIASLPAWRAANLALWQIGTSEENARLLDARYGTLATVFGLYGTILLARAGRTWRERYGGTCQVFYSNGRSTRVPLGFSVLEASRAAKIPHASICGGRARCSTCRLRVIGGGEPPASPGEQAVLDWVAAGPSVRLACQWRPVHDVIVAPLIQPHAAYATLRRRELPPAGEERYVVVLAVDMRDSIRLAETRMPYDTVFIIDRFLATVGAAVTEAGGRATQFTGDGLIAAFGLTCSPAMACRQAIAALFLIASKVAALNEAMAHQLDEPLRFGIGIHGSTAVVGEVGFAETRVFTTLGDAANVACRLEALCKSFGSQAIVSDEVCSLSGLPLATLPLYNTLVRGRQANVGIRVIKRIPTSITT